MTEESALPAEMSDFPRLWSKSVENPAIGAITLAGAVTNGRGCGDPDMRILGSYALVYLVAGGGRYADATGVDRSVGAGDLLLIFPELAHRYGPGPGQRWAEVYLVFDGPVFDLWRQQGLLCPDRPVLHLQPLEYWLQRFCAVLTSPVDPTASATLREVCRLQEVLAEVIAHDRDELAGGDAWSRQARRLLEAADPAEADLAAVARRMNLSTDAFRKRFTRSVGLSPHRYRSARLIERACRMMQEGRLSDQQIAAALGFADAFHFSKRFKQLMGRSPRAFRRQLPRGS